MVRKVALLVVVVVGIFGLPLVRNFGDEARITFDVIGNDLLASIWKEHVIRPLYIIAVARFFFAVVNARVLVLNRVVVRVLWRYLQWNKKLSRKQRPHTISFTLT